MAEYERTKRVIAVRITRKELLATIYAAKSRVRTMVGNLRLPLEGRKGLFAFCRTDESAINNDMKPSTSPKKVAMKPLFDLTPLDTYLPR